MLILIYPPVAKPCEPPAGISRLSGMLRSLDLNHCIVDANIEALLSLIESPEDIRMDDAWTKRAFRNRRGNLASLRSSSLYHNPDRYRRAVRDLGRVLTKASPPGITVGLANYEQKGLSPLRSKDLLSAAEHFHLNPFYPYFRTRLSKLFQEQEPAMIGISLNYLSQALCAFSMIGFIRRELPKVKILLGGGLITSWITRPHWANPFTGLVDQLIAGPGEDALLSMLGIRAPEGNVWRPDYHAVLANPYLSPGFVLPYSASTGCYWSKCTFCPEKAEGTAYRPIPPRQVIADLKACADATDPVLVHLLDNALSPSLLKSLAENSIGVPWYGFVRISNQLTDLDFCIALKKAGCIMLKLGIESGDQGVLDTMQKGISVKNASVVLKNLKKAGIASSVYLLFGTPAETEESARRTLAFTVKHGESINFLNLAIFNMPAYGELTHKTFTKGFYEGDLSLYTDFIHPHGWDRKRVRRFLDHEFRRHPAISAILKNEIQVFTSNHAPFFVMSGV